MDGGAVIGDIQARPADLQRHVLAVLQGVVVVQHQVAIDLGGPGKGVLAAQRQSASGEAVERAGFADLHAAGAGDAPVEGGGRHTSRGVVVVDRQVVGADVQARRVAVAAEGGHGHRAAGNPRHVQVAVIDDRTGARQGALGRGVDPQNVDEARAAQHHGGAAADFELAAEGRAAEVGQGESRRALKIEHAGRAPGDRARVGGADPVFDDVELVVVEIDAGARDAGQLMDRVGGIDTGVQREAGARLLERDVVAGGDVAIGAQSQVPIDLRGAGISLGAVDLEGPRAVNRQRRDLVPDGTGV